MNVETNSSGSLHPVSLSSLISAVSGMGFLLEGSLTSSNTFLNFLAPSAVLNLMARFSALAPPSA